MYCVPDGESAYFVQNTIIINETQYGESAEYVVYKAPPLIVVLAVDV
jgi:hypothetical protein